MGKFICSQGALSRLRLSGCQQPGSGLAFPKRGLLAGSGTPPAVPHNFKSLPLLAAGCLMGLGAADQPFLLRILPDRASEADRPVGRVAGAGTAVLALPVRDGCPPAANTVEELAPMIDDRAEFANPLRPLEIMEIAGTAPVAADRLPCR